MQREAKSTLLASDDLAMFGGISFEKRKGSGISMETSHEIKIKKIDIISGWLGSMFD